MFALHNNRILAALVQRRGDLTGRLLRVDFVHGEMFGQFGDPISEVVFPVSGMVSVVVALKEGELVEAAMIGHHGVVGGSAAFGATDHIYTSFCQLPGRAYRFPAVILADVVREDDTLRSMIFAHEQFMQFQAQQTAACNAKHHVMQRLSTWLLRAKDVAGSNEMSLTQEFLAQMLGVQRASVSGFAAQLQDMEFIRYRRGRLSIVDEAGLAGQACECHERLASFQKRLLPAMAQTPSVPHHEGLSHAADQRQS